MDDEPTVNEQSPHTGARKCLQCDQAVFTSVRSLMGEGYQIVAASSGITPQEKADIVRNSPSHGSLRHLKETLAVGLLSYTLASGRRCATYCCHAGKEQSGRGGNRVYSHMVLLDQPNFALFDSDVTGVHKALEEAVHRSGTILQTMNAMKPLPINIPAQPVNEEGTCTLTQLSTADSKWLWPVAGEILAGRKTALVGLEEPFAFLKWLLLILPRSVREAVDVSVNVSFSPSRRLRLIFLPNLPIHVERLVASQTITLMRAGQPVPPIEPAYAPWLELLRALWSQGHFTDMIGLAAQVPGQVSASSLNGLAHKYNLSEASLSAPSL